MPDPMKSETDRNELMDDFYDTQSISENNAVLTELTPRAAAARGGIIAFTQILG